MAQTKIVICPYCGASQPAEDFCRVCGGLYDELSRQASHNDMGPWFIRNEKRSHQPGCSYETLVRLIERGQVDRYTIIRGPTTKQFWTVARRIPGVAHLLGYCHNCDEQVSADDHGCPSCGVPFGAYLDRNHLGLPEVRPMPWDADAGDSELSPSVSGAASTSSVSGTKTRWTSSGDERGISSFASNDEIATNGREQHSTRDAPASTGYATHSSHLPSMTHADPVGGSSIQVSPDHERLVSPESQITRTLRREIARQRRIVTMLTVTTVIAVIMILVTNLNRLSGSGSQSPSPAATPRTSPPPPPPGEKTPISSTEELADPSSQDVARIGQDADDAFQGVADPGVVEALTPKPTRREQALELITRGKDETRSLADRIKSYEAALELLKAVRKEQGAGSPTEELDTLIQESTLELERLRLREFFP